jgi:hypothetical protein
MATYNKFNQTVEEWLHGTYAADTDQFTVALCAAANAPVATNSVLADLTEISYTNLSSRNLTTSTAAQSSGTYTQLFADLTLSASGGAVATFRYVVIYNNTPASPLDPLLCWYDYGSDLTLADGESLLIDFTTSTFTVT